MAHIKIKYNPTQSQSLFHDDITSDMVGFFGGLGCIHNSSKVLTANGYFHPEELRQGLSTYASYHHQSGEMTLSLGGAMYPKGKGDLYRVVHEQGEFVANAQHLVFSSQCNYISLENASSHPDSCKAFYSPQEKTFSEALSVLPLNAFHLNHIAQDFQSCYQEYSRSYDARLHLSLGIYQDDSPLRACVLKLFRTLCLIASERGDVLAEQLQERSHRDKLFDLSGKMDYRIQSVEPASVWEYLDSFATRFEHILQSLQVFRQFHDSSSSHLKVLEFSDLIYKTLLLSFAKFTPFPKPTKVLAIEKQKSNDWYWDTHVLGTNNYIADGAIHHNSGKSYALAYKLIKLSWLNRGHAGGLLSPSVMDFKRDMLPIFQEMFDNHNLTGLCKYDRQDTCFRFPWTSKPLYVFTAERPIAGPNLAYCGINEPSLIKEVRINEMLRRVRVKDAPVKQRCLAGTPEDVHGYLQDFIEKMEKKGKLRLIQASTKENHHLDEEYYQHLKDTLDPQSFRVFAEGELIFIGKDLFYYAYSKENETDITLQEDMPLYINLDFNVGRMTATISQNYWRNNGKEKIVVFCDEIELNDHNADTYAMISAIKSRYSSWLKSKDFMITCDFSGKARKTTGPSDVNVLRQTFGDEFVRYRATGNIRFRKRQLMVNGLLHHKRILINADKCPILKKDMTKVTQKEDFSKDKKNPKLTHASDTLDYLCDFEFEQVHDRYHVYKAM